MLESIFVSAAFMVFEIFVLIKWLQRRESDKDQAAWMPFRKLLLDAIVRHIDELNIIAKEYIERTKADLDAIRDHGSFTERKQRSLEASIERTTGLLEDSQKRFFNILQTVGPSIKPYVAQYCNEVLWFSDSIQKSLDEAKDYFSSISLEVISDNKQTSHQLNGVSAMLTSITMFHEMRFSQFKSDFTQSIWKTEGLHFYEKDNEFLLPEDFAKALDGDKAMAQMNKIPRILPIKSFFEK